MIPLLSPVFSPLFGPINVGKGDDPDDGQSALFGSSVQPVFGAADEAAFDGGSGGGSGGGTGGGSGIFDGIGGGSGAIGGGIGGDGTIGGTIPGIGGAFPGGGTVPGDGIYAGGNPDFDESAGGGYFGSDGIWNPDGNSGDFPFGGILDGILGSNGEQTGYQDEVEVRDGAPAAPQVNPDATGDEYDSQMAIWQDWFDEWAVGPAVGTPTDTIGNDGLLDGESAFGGEPQSVGDWVRMAEDWAKANPDSEYVTPEEDRAAQSTANPQGSIGGGGEIPISIGDIVDNPDGTTTPIGDLEADKWGDFNFDDVDWNVAMGGDENSAAKTFEDYVDMVGGISNVDWGAIAETVGLGDIFNNAPLDLPESGFAGSNIVAGENAGIPGSTEGLTGDGGFFGADQGWGALPMELGKAAATALSGESYGSEDWSNAYMTTMLSMIPFVGPVAALGFNMFGGFGGEEGPTDQDIKDYNMSVAKNAWQSSTGRRAPISPSSGGGDFFNLTTDGGNALYTPFIDREFEFDPSALFVTPDGDPIGSSSAPGLAEDYSVGSVGFEDGGMTDDAFFGAWQTANPDYDPYDIESIFNSMSAFGQDTGVPTYQWESSLANHEAFSHTATGWESDRAAWKEENPDLFQQQFDDYTDWTRGWFYESPEGSGEDPAGQNYVDGLISQSVGQGPFGGIRFNF